LAERMTVVISPPTIGTNLIVEEAMRQVLEVFELMSYGSESGRGVVWRLIEAKTNSPPFSVLAEAEAESPGYDVDIEARSQKLKFARNLSEYRSGVIADGWDDYDAHRLANSIIERAANRSIVTSIQIDDNAPPIVITVVDATEIRVKHETLSSNEAFSKTKTQIGSIEGVLTDVTTHYGKPALKLVERKSGAPVRCLIPEELIGQFDSKAKFRDVWERQRVVVRGVIRYGDHGDIKEISASSIDSKQSREVSIEEITDRNFTNGLSVSEYLDKLREGELG